MSLLFMDGFDHYESGQASKKWNGGTSGGNHQATPTGRTGDCLRIGGQNRTRYIGKEITTFVFGTAWQTNQPLDQAIVHFYDGVSWQVNIRYEANEGRLEIIGPGGLIGNSPNGSISINTWYYIELKCTIDNSLGTVEFKINGNEEINETGVDTQASSNNYINKLWIGSNQWYSFFDDLYLLDTTGSTNNDFLGDCKVETLVPDGAGNYTQWTPLSGNNWENVDDTTPDDDSTYVSTSGTDFKDTYTFDNLTTGVAEIYGVQSNVYARKDDADFVGIEGLYRINSTDYTVSGGNLSDTYTYQTKIKEKNPDTDAQWTVTDVNSLEFGYNKNL